MMNTTREGSYSVLVVEDSPTQAVQIAADIESGGHDVTLAGSAEEARDLLLNEGAQVDIVVSDIVMPGEDGFELCTWINAQPQFEGLPVILLTALRERGDVVRGINAGADSFVTKPYSAEFLLNQIDYLVRNRRDRDQGHFDSMEINYDGQVMTVTSHPRKIVDLLLSTYMNAIEINRELFERNNELSRMRDQLEKTNRELASANEQKNEFLGMVVHDLRHPIGTIRGYASFLRDAVEHEDKEDALSLLDGVERSANRMLAIIEELLDVSAIESGKVKLRLTSVSIPALLQQTVELRRHDANTKGMQIHLSILDEPDAIEGDWSKLMQVFDNLLSNAIKYSPRGSRIDVRVGSGPGAVAVEVQDQGPGIAASEQELLFQPFSRTSSVPTGGEASTGLGLAIVRKLVEAHGGTIGVESESGQGSLFRVVLPYRRSRG
ncbi:MAG: hybrid sensor histidine kinase/response regulator [Candidatus Dadabacteria bacterium]|nr:MAG: hybrid sensor histidine kinase/response regulator [Candidatus Dadabacteria bacterium]